ncbi:carbohydrate ABC transporter membrane protein 1, CUT1 family [Marinactinospora thermotolerans DSM 45154]|uniref:Carbohydrate ABC transporter membrane protein 1, CUT1 family n=1 Tax=Marinactinospora thermotolerans DSM 45154 TaxID=1122192 RepID=A0A1T4TGY6_9ACTN|nr:carbohydrate ABC transporter membrane protein 1, CUT1 family [Marinactinospora thermotolerans DSM 45154]
MGRPAAATRPGRRRGRFEHWFYLSPALVVLAALLVYPLYQLVLVSLYDYRQAQVSGAQPLRFIGFDNYATLLGDPRFWGVLGNTVVFAAACVVGTLLVGGALAVLATRLRPWVRTVLFLTALGAWATPAVTGSAVWLFLFDPTLGLVNQVLVGVGLEGFAGHSWTYEKWSAFGLVGAEVIWCSFPFVMVTLYAGITSIPEEVVEAARLDGASTLRIAHSIMLPMLRPVLAIVTIQSIIWDFKIFTQIYIMTGGGGISGQNMVLNVYGYQQAFAASQYGLGSAIGVITSLLLLAITLVYLRALRRNGEVL